jgi:hypothetical protein
MLEKGLVSPVKMILPVEITVSTRGMPKGSIQVEVFRLKG